jgi:predicted signal transduction protein with EAL and GGDEF domain
MSSQRLRGRIDDQALHATANIGVSVIVDPAQNLAKLITLADQALHLAKARGRNRVEVAPLEVSLGNEAPGRPMVHAAEQSAA